MMIMLQPCDVRKRTLSIIHCLFYLSMYVFSHQKCGHLFGVRVDDVAISVHGYRGDAGTGEEDRHALDTANSFTQPGLKSSN